MLRGLLLVLTCALVVLLGSASAASAKGCSVAGKERKLGATYVTTLSVKGVSCRTGETVVKAFHACRFKKGKAGRCTKRVRGYRCTERRFDKIATQYDARVTCKRGSKVVGHTYQQFT